MSDRRTTRLRNVLTENRPRVAVEPHGLYPMLGVYGFGRGVILREAVWGGSISAQHLYRVSAGQIVYSRLKAFEGAFSVVPDEADDRFVTSEFPAFDMAKDLALPEYLSLVLSQPSAWDALAVRSNGVGARRERLQVDDFLDFELELPDVAEQRLVVASAHVAKRMDTASDGAVAAADQLLEAMRRQAWGTCGRYSRRAIGEVRLSVDDRR